jgi:hypothetical protein
MPSLSYTAGPKWEKIAALADVMELYQHLLVDRGNHDTPLLEWSEGGIETASSIEWQSTALTTRPPCLCLNTIVLHKVIELLQSALVVVSHCMLCNLSLSLRQPVVANYNVTTSAWPTHCHNEHRSVNNSCFVCSSSERLDRLSGNVTFQTLRDH